MINNVNLHGANTDDGEHICHVCHALKPHCTQVVVLQDGDDEVKDWVCKDCLPDNCAPCDDCGKMMLIGAHYCGHSDQPKPVYGYVGYLMDDGERVFEKAIVGYTNDQSERGICCHCLTNHYQPCAKCGDDWRKDELVDAVIGGQVVKICRHCAFDMIKCERCGRPCDAVDDSGDDLLCALCANEE